VHAAGPRVVVDEEAAAADAGGERLGDPERRGGRDSGIDGVAATAKDVDAGVGRVAVDSRDGASVALRDGRLGAGGGGHARRAGGGS
jgi:hypothetical protein